MKTSIHLLTFALLPHLLFAGSLPNSAPPNIIWITSEDNSAEWLACYGNPHSQTPHLDQLARDGFQYMHTYANAPVCAPSRSTWITGMHALSTGTHPMRSTNTIPPHISFYPELLQQQGYFTGNAEKTDYNISSPQRFKTMWNNPGPVDWNALQQNQPFFQIINFFSTHESSAFNGLDDTQHDPQNTTPAPYHPEHPTIRKNIARYHDSIHQMDQQVGAVLQTIEKLNLAENTIVIYCSDHGGVLPRSKRFLFQNGLHCPLIIRIPETYKSLWPAPAPGQKIDRLVSFIDMPKTWLSLARAPIPEQMQGRIFLGNQTEAEADSHFAFRGRADERIENARAICDKRYLYIRNYMPYVPWLQHLTYLWRIPASQTWQSAIKNQTFTDLQRRYHQPKTLTEELYDMQQDPHNIHNLAQDPAHQKTLQRLRNALREQQLTYYDSGLLPESEMVRLTQQHNTTVYDLIRNPRLYPLDRLLDAADLALAQQPSDLPALREYLHHTHIGIRYWGAVGCFLQNDLKGAHIAREDQSHEIRAIAAWTLIRNRQAQAGIELLNQLLNQPSYAQLTLLNILDWMETPDPKLIDTIHQLPLNSTTPKNIKPMLIHLRNKHPKQNKEKTENAPNAAPLE